MLGILISILLTQTWALESGRNLAHSLLHAQSAEEINRLRRDYVRMQTAQIACEIELIERIAPVSCYEAIALEMPERSEQKSLRLAHLDSLCTSAAKQLRLSEPGAYVSKSCARSLRDAREIQKYRDEEVEAWSSY